MRYDLYHKLMSVSGNGAALLESQATPEHQIKLIALDIDGTLLRNDQQLSVDVIDTINEVSAQAIPIVLVTARPPANTSYLFNQLNIAPIQANFDGAYISDGLHAEPVLHLTLEEHVVIEMINIARMIDTNAKIRVDIGNEWYTDRHRDVPSTDAKKVQPKTVGDFELVLTEPSTRISILANADSIKRIREIINSKYGDYVSLPYSDARLLQIIHAKAGKASALKWIADQFGISRKHVMAIGDGPNDRSMINWAGWGVALNNAWPIVKAASNAIVPSNEEDGVARALQKFVLSEI